MRLRIDRQQIISPEDSGIFEYPHAEYKSSIETLSKSIIDRDQHGAPTKGHKSKQASSKCQQQRRKHQPESTCKRQQ